ncbi:MAG: DEAD/DEAH box helicase [Bacteroidaceae bacterium]
MKNFEELGVSGDIRRAIEEMGFVEPMPVQEEVIPFLLGEGNDVVALAQTGTGKTAAFGLPIVQKVDVKNRVPQSLILSPTRELCLQIAGDLSDYSKYVDGLKVLPVYGGSSIESQIRSLKRGVHIIVATPGRLIDLMSRGVVSLKTIKNVIMDEADEMLNMGFTDSINQILADIPKERNTLLFSATMSPEISRISKKYLNNATEITIGGKNESTNNVEHVSYLVNARDKYAALKRIADFYPQIYGIIFCRTRRETQEIADKLMQDGYNADALHGELSQAQRDVVMQKFRIKNLQILVATDVAARGLDVDNLTHVINYGLPDDIESYTHRSGRTGRAGRTGTSIAIINMREKGKLRQIERTIKKQFKVGELPSGQNICEQQLLKVIDDIEKVKVNEGEIEKFMPEITRKLEWLSREDIIKRMVSTEFNRFLEYYQNQPELLLSTEKGDRSRRDNDGGSRSAEGFTRLFINLGKVDGCFPRQLMELINSNTKQRVELGDISIMKSFSFFEVEESKASHVLEVLNDATFRDRTVSVEVASEANSGSSSDSAPRRRDGGGSNNRRDFGNRSGYGSSRGGNDRGGSRGGNDRGGSRGGNDRGGSRGGSSRGGSSDRRSSSRGGSDRNASSSNRSAQVENKPSREDRGYSDKRGERNDWSKFFKPGYDPNKDND